MPYENFNGGDMLYRLAKQAGFPDAENYRILGNRAMHTHKTPVTVGIKLVSDTLHYVLPANTTTYFSFSTSSYKTIETAQQMFDVADPTKIYIRIPGVYFVHATALLSSDTANTNLFQVDTNYTGPDVDGAGVICQGIVLKSATAQSTQHTISAPIFLPEGTWLRLGFVNYSTLYDGEATRPMLSATMLQPYLADAHDEVMKG